MARALGVLDLLVGSLDGVDVLAGLLHSRCARSTESASFRYDDSYLSRADAYALDPALPLASGAQQTTAGLQLFRALADGSTGTWGRKLLLRQERLRAREERVTSRTVSELELLLGVRDDLRQGALRYQAGDGPSFLTPSSDVVPRLSDLPALLHAADHVGSDEATSQDLDLLVQAGSSLGGDRPKVHVVTDDARAAIAEHERWLRGRFTGDETDMLITLLRRIHNGE